MDDQELFNDIKKDADEGHTRSIIFNPLPRALHTFTVVSSKLEKNKDGSRTLAIVANITDESPEKGLSFRVQQMVVNKEGKKMASGMAMAAGLFAAAKVANMIPSAFAGNLEGCTGTGWLDIDSYSKSDKVYHNQVLFWGSEEPPKIVSKASTKSLASSEEAPF